MRLQNFNTPFVHFAIHCFLSFVVYFYCFLILTRFKNIGIIQELVLPFNVYFLQVKAPAFCKQVPSLIPLFFDRFPEPILVLLPHSLQYYTHCLLPYPGHSKIDAHRIWYHYGPDSGLFWIFQPAFGTK